MLLRSSMRSNSSTISKGATRQDLRVCCEEKAKLNEAIKDKPIPENFGGDFFSKLILALASYHKPNHSANTCY
jgi:hypothetical protein